MPRKRRVEKMDTDTIDNVLVQADFIERPVGLSRYADYSQRRMKFHMDLHEAKERLGLGSVGFHQSILGAWDFTSQSGGYRYRVWEFPTWRIFVADGYGVGFEVLRGTSADDAMKAWDDYIAKVFP